MIIVCPNTFAHAHTNTQIVRRVCVCKHAYNRRIHKVLHSNEFFVVVVTLDKTVLVRLIFFQGRQFSMKWISVYECVRVCARKQYVNIHMFALYALHCMVVDHFKTVQNYVRIVLVVLWITNVLVCECVIHFGWVRLQFRVRINTCQRTHTNVYGVGLCVRVLVHYQP